MNRKITISGFITLACIVAWLVMLVLVGRLSPFWSRYVLNALSVVTVCSALVWLGIVVPRRRPAEDFDPADDAGYAEGYFDAKTGQPPREPVGAGQIPPSGSTRS